MTVGRIKNNGERSTRMSVGRIKNNGERSTRMSVGRIENNGERTQESILQQGSKAICGLKKTIKKAPVITGARLT